jgi:hypothetical protein
MNKMYCVTTLQSTDQNIEREFNDLLDKLLDYNDSERICGYDFNNTSIYLMDIDDYKVIEIVNFLNSKVLLIKVAIVDNIIEFILSEQKYTNLYIDDRNNTILNKYIKKNTSVDDVLERLSVVKLNNLLPIELSILNGNDDNVITNKQFDIVEKF